MEVKGSSCDEEWGIEVNDCNGSCMMVVGSSCDDDDDDVSVFPVGSDIQYTIVHHIYFHFSQQLQ